jgi:hypothetical protein
LFGLWFRLAGGFGAVWMIGVWVDGMLVIVIVAVVMAVGMIVRVPMIVTVGVLGLQAAHAGAEGVAEFAVGDV